MPNRSPLKRFIVQSNYDNDNRRCWFDKLLIQTIEGDKPKLDGEVYYFGYGEGGKVVTTGLPEGISTLRFGASSGSEEWTSTASDWGYFNSTRGNKTIWMNEDAGLSGTTPTSGSYISITPSEDGLIAVYLGQLNLGKTVVVSTASGQVTTRENNNSSAQPTMVSFDAIANTEYFIYGSGTKPRLLGFSFTPKGKYVWDFTQPILENRVDDKINTANPNWRLQSTGVYQYNTGSNVDQGNIITFYDSHGNDLFNGLTFSSNGGNATTPGNCYLMIGEGFVMRNGNKYLSIPAAKVPNLSTITVEYGWSNNDQSYASISADGATLISGEVSHNPSVWDETYTATFQSNGTGDVKIIAGTNRTLFKKITVVPAIPKVEFAAKTVEASIHTLTTDSPVLTTEYLVGTVTYSVINGTGRAIVDGSTGKVTMIAPGTVTVKARSEDDDLEDTYTLTILDTPTYESTSTNGSYTVTAAGYVDSNKLIDNDFLTVTVGNSGQTLVATTNGYLPNVEPTTVGLYSIRGDGGFGTRLTSNTSLTPPTQGTYYTIIIKEPLDLTIKGVSSTSQSGHLIQLTKDNGDGTTTQLQTWYPDRKAETTHEYSFTTAGTYYFYIERADNAFFLRDITYKLLKFEEETKTAYLEDLTFAYPATYAGVTPTYSITFPTSADNECVALADASTGSLRLVRPGTVTVTATSGSYSDSYTLTVTTRNELSAASMVDGEWFRVGTTVGQIMDESVNINGVTLNFGANTDSSNGNKNELQVVRQVRSGQYGITCIDLSGNTWGLVESGKYWGTYYKLVIPSPGRHITFTGYFDADKELRILDGSYSIIKTISNTGTETLSFEYGFNPGTYYVYSPAWTAFCLNSMRVELPRQDVTFSSTEVYKVLNTLALDGLTYQGPQATNSSADGGDIVYTSSNESAATVDSDGKITLVGSGITTINATATAVANTYSETTRSYTLNVNIKEDWNSAGHPQKWLFDKTLGAQWTSSEAQFKSTGGWNAGTTTRPNGTGKITFAQLTYDGSEVLPETKGLLFDTNEAYNNGDRSSRLSVRIGNYVNLGVGVRLRIPNLEKGQVVSIVMNAGSNNQGLVVTNGQLITDRSTDRITVNTGVVTVSFVVGETSAEGVTLKNSGGADNIFIRAIYINTPVSTQGTLTYDGDNELLVNEEALPSTNYAIKDKWGRDLNQLLFGSTYGYTSVDASKVSINNTTTGDIAAVAGTNGTAVSGYASSNDPLNYNDAVLSASVRVVDYQAKKAQTIYVSDLMYLPMKTSEGNGLDRTIPRFNLTLTGGTKLMSNGTGEGLTFNGGTLTFTPQYNASHTTNVLFTSATLFYDDGSFEVQEPSTATSSLAITKREHVLTRIVLEYQSSDATSNPDNQLNLGLTPTSISYSSSVYTLQAGNTRPAIAPETTTPKNLRGISYSITSGGHVTLAANQSTITSVSAGSETLTARFGGNKYFDAAADATCTITVTSGTCTATLDIANKIKVAPTPSIDGFAFASETLTPSLEVKQGETKLTQGTDYTVAYMVSDASLVYINNKGEIITQRNAEGLVTITANITLTSSGEMLSQSFKLQVISGEWIFNKFTESKAQKLNNQNSSLVNYWDGPINNHNYARNTELQYEYMLDKDMEPFSMAMALQSRGNVRWTYNGNDETGHFYMFGKDADPDHPYGGVLKIPVLKGMVIEINAYSGSNDFADMMINTTGEIQDEGDEYAAVSDFNKQPVVGFQIHSQATSQQFLVTNTGEDGFIYLVNSSSNLPMQINWIKLTRGILFDYGTETFVQMVPSSSSEAATFVNPISNRLPDDEFTYEFENPTATAIAQSIDSEGNVTFLKDTYGTYKVFVTRTSDDYTASYTTHVVNFEVKATDSKVNTDITTLDANYLTLQSAGLVTSIGYNTNDGLTEDAMRSKVEVSILDSETTIPHATLSGSTGNQSLTVQGVGKVALNLTLGAITKKSLITFGGAALTTEVPVVPLTATSYTFEFSGEPRSVTIDVDKIKAGVLGDLRSLVTENKLSFTLSGSNLTISRTDGQPFGYGGAIPIEFTYYYDANGNEMDEESEKHTVTGVLTVAYDRHAWHFDHNMLYYDNEIYDGLGDFYTNEGTKSREGEWTQEASFGFPAGQAGELPDWPATGAEKSSNKWQFVRKMGNNNPESAIIYNYRNSVYGTNALVMPETAGLQIFSNKGNTKNDGQFGVEMMSTRTTEGTVGGQLIGVANVVTTKNFKTHTNVTGYDVQNVMLRSGGQLMVPKVKPGQWIEMRWYRHRPDKGERLQLTNLCDVNGTLVTSTYKIGNTENATYLFQVNPSLTDEYVDAVFTITDNVYISIQEVILHEPGWNYRSSIGLTGWADASDHTDTDLTQNELKLTGTDGSFDTPYVYLCDGQTHQIQFSAKTAQFGPTAPTTWQITVVGENDATVNSTDAYYNSQEGTKTRWARNEDHNNDPIVGEWPDGETTLTWSKGWGKAYVTMNSYTTNYKYVANRKTWVITFGEQPAQTYPYTWDFTKYFTATKTTVSGTADEMYQEDVHYNASDNPTGAHEYRQTIDTWQASGDSEQALSSGYGTGNYSSLFVNGAQLVSYGLRSNETYKGRLPETAGLGFSLAAPEADVLSLDMQSTVGSSGAGASSNATWRNGKLSISGGGTVIVPSPGSNATDFYLYVLASAEPSIDGAVLAKQTGDVSEDDEQEKQYRYHFLQDKDAVLTFASDAEVYQIGVTDIMKPLTKVGSEGWATESRERVIDHTLTGRMTVNQALAHKVTLDGYDPTGNTGVKESATVELEQVDVVPARQGVVLRQKTPGLTGNVSVPLFVPAVTTAQDAAYSDNLMMAHPNIRQTEDAALYDQSAKFTEEQENADGIDTADGDYVRFILAKKFMTWVKTEDQLTTPTQFEEQEAAVFYRLHVYSDVSTLTGLDASEDTPAELNSLGARKAYLHLPKANIPDALWKESTAPARRMYLPIKGVSDFDEAFDDAPVRSAAQGTYNLKGQAVDESHTLRPGVYIRNGRKVVVK